MNGGKAGADGSAAAPIEDGSHAPHLAELWPTDLTSDASTALGSLDSDLADVTAHASRGATRYAPGLEIGRGAMGRVRLVHDARLLRDIAWKEGDAHVLREAWITAQLEHPGIVPVHDLGQTPDGQSFFAMRAIRGRTLGDALARLDRSAPTAELPVVRALLQVAQAVAWAHHRGVVHRDLKPANILVGPFGEVQVVDWGLAQVIDNAPEPLADGARAAIARLPIGVDAIAGTPRYMSPEQAAGAATDARSDVWALGVILYEILAGRSPLPADSRTSVLAMLAALHADPAAPTKRTAQANQTPGLVPLRDAAPAAPPELQAIVARALEPAPSRRYPDARAFADDLAAFLDGRRVDAYTYRTRDHLRRFVRAFRLPLFIGGTALLAFVVFGVIALDRIATQRDAALAAQAATASALHEADRHLAEALVAEARNLVRQGVRPEAERLAARALLLVEHPEARGILAALAASPAPTRGPALVGPACAKVDVDPTGGRLLCHSPPSFSLWRIAPDAPSERLWTATSSRTLIAFAAGGSRLVLAGGRGPMEVRDSVDGRLVAYLETGNGSVVVSAHSADRWVLFEGMYHAAVVDAVALTSESLPACDQYLGTTIDRTGRWAAMCADGALAIGDLGQPAATSRVQTPFQVHSNESTALAFLPDGSGMVVADAEGGVSLVANDGHVIRRQRPVAGLVRLLEESPDGQWLTIAGEAEHVVLLDLPGLGHHGSLPMRDGHRVRWLDDGTLITVGRRDTPTAHRVTLGGPELPAAKDGSPIIRRWHPTAGRPFHLDLVDGVTSVALDSQGRRLVASHHTDASLVELSQGSARREIAGDQSVVKSVAFDAADTAYIGATSGRFLRIGAPPEADEPRPLAFPGSMTRRYVAAGGWLFAAPFGRTLWAARDTGSATVATGPWLELPPREELGARVNQYWVDLATASAARGPVAALSPDGLIRLVTIPREGLPEIAVVAQDPNAVAVAPFVDGALIAAAGGDRVIVWDVASATVSRTLLAPGADLLEVASDVAGTFVAAGSRDGAVFVWRLGPDGDDNPRAIFRGHSERAVSLEFDLRGDLLVSGAWDGNVYLHSLAILDQSPGELAAAVAATWGSD